MAPLIDTLKVAGANRTVWVFGAGASAFYDIPTQARILQRLAVMKRPGNNAVQDGLNGLRKKVQQHCRLILPGLDITDDRLSLEEVFSAFELRQTEARSTGEEISKAEAAFDDLIEALRVAMCVFGPGTLQKWKPHRRNGTFSPYAELIEKLVPVGPPRPPPHCLVTFNYDICLDRCLINLRGSGAEYDLDYGFQLANSRCSKAPNFGSPRDGQSLLTLRTHGSLNWRRCKACHNVFTTLNSQSIIRDSLRCYACGKKRMDYVLVHPSFNRRYDDPLLQIVWGRLSEELLGADRWVFVGYSLPPADFHFRELLRDCLRSRRSRAKPTEIVLVDRGQETDQAFIRVRESYEWLFGKNLSVWKPTPGGFADFVAALS